MPSSKDDDLKKLQKIWYEKLKQSGFEDIESEDSRYLKQWHSQYFQCRYEADLFELKAAYYRRASHFLHHHPFQWIKGSSLINIEERETWRLHTEGLSYRDIAKHLLSLGFKTNKDRINKTVSKLLKIMKDSFLDDYSAISSD